MPCVPQQWWVGRIHSRASAGQNYDSPMDGALAVEPDRPGGGAARWALTLVIVAGAVWVLVTEAAIGIAEAVNVQQGGFESPGQWLRVAALVLLGLVGPATALLVWRVSRKQDLGVAISLRRSALGAMVGLLALVPLLVLSAI